LHLAAHGVFEYVPRVASGAVPAKPVTGLVMSDGLYFTAETASQMRVVPDLVFINCCNLGNTERDVQYHRIAANLATQFIQVGARVVIAAGWAVDDRAAKLFATTLYTELFAGARFGDAVQRARAEVFSNFGHTNTWGAYQCYGDTEFSLGVRPNDARVEPAVAPIEVSLRVRQLTEQVRQVDAVGRKRLLSELEHTIASLPQAFWETADLPAAVGGAFSALGELERALSYYERAFSNTSGEATLQCVEQWANLTSRVAKSALLKAAGAGGRDGADGGDVASKSASGKGASVTRADASKKAASAAAKAWRRLPEAEAKLRALLAIAPTPERYAMLGSLHKTRAMHASGPARLRELEKMIEAYRAAYEHAKDKQLTHAVYGLTNTLAGELTLGWCSPKQSRAKGARKAALQLTELGVLASRLAEQSTTFFELAGRADYALLESLFAEKLGASQQTSIATAYEYAAQRGAAASQLDSLYAHVEFYTTIAESQLRGEERRRITTFLKKLRARLERIR